MKKIFRTIYPFLFILLVLASCKKDEVQAIVKPESAKATLASNTATIVLDSMHATDSVLIFTWPAVNYNYNANVTYSLQFDLPADSFKNAVIQSIGLDVLTKKYSVQDLNNIAIQNFNLPGATASKIQVRLASDLKQNGTTTGLTSISTIYSNVITLTVTPYAVKKVYPKLWVTGDFQGWAVANAPTVASANSNGVYEGYVYFPSSAPSFTFKYTDAPDWNHLAYGYVSGTTMSSTASGNLYTSGAGYFLMKADVNALTWSATKTTWSVIGDATPGGWSTDTPMTFDPATNTWTCVVALVNTGNFKFRANNDWAINYGFDNGVLDLNGSNIPVPATGSATYKITMDLSNAPNYTYSIAKQ